MPCMARKNLLQPECLWWLPVTAKQVHQSLSARNNIQTRINTFKTYLYKQLLHVLQCKGTPVAMNYSCQHDCLIPSKQTTRLVLSAPNLYTLASLIFGVLIGVVCIFWCQLVWFTLCLRPKSSETCMHANSGTHTSEA